MAKWLKKNIVNIILIVIVLAGLCLLLYPTFSDWWNSMHQSRAIAAYVETVDAMSQEEIDSIFAAAREYNERLWHRSNRWLLSDEERAEYESLLDISGNGIMGYINIPVIGVNLPIYHGTDEAVLQVASGHLSSTSLPVGGPGTHAAVSGHRGLPSARLFTDLDQLKVGDIFTISVLNEVYTYQIEQIVTVVPEDTSQMNLFQGEDLCTLQTCTPYGVNSHRLLLRGRRIEDVDGALLAASEALRVPNHIVIPAVGIPILFLLLLIALIYFRRRKPKLTPDDLRDLLKKK